MFGSSGLHTASSTVWMPNFEVGVRDWLEMIGGPRLAEKSCQVAVLLIGRAKLWQQPHAVRNSLFPTLKVNHLGYENMSYRDRDTRHLWP